MRCKTFPDTFGDGDGPAEPGIGQHQCKLVAAKPGHHIGLPRATLNDGGGLHEGAAAKQMPMGIVDGLEAVQVDEQQRKRTATARSALGFATEYLVEVTRIVELCQV